MNTYDLTEKTKNFILSKYNTGILSGKESYALPYSNNSDDTSITYTSSISGTVTTTQFMSQLIEWYNKYGNEYSVNANILAAQTYAESLFKVWRYSRTGALGISQFVPDTINDRIIKNSNFSNEEKNLLLYNIVGDIDSRSNRVQLHQNIIDNPEIMIKGQAVLMNFIMNRNNLLAASSLFAYNRGSSYQSKTYSGLIAHVKTKKGATYCVEGLNYVEKIFNLLSNEFGLTLDTAADYITSTYGAGAYEG